MCCQVPRAKAAPGRGSNGLDGRGAERIQGFAFTRLGLSRPGSVWSMMEMERVQYDGVQTTKSPGQWAMGPGRSEQCGQCIWGERDSALIAGAE